MLDKPRRDWIRLLGEEYILALLESLEESPKRFSDLSVCPNEKTRARKLRVLEERGLVEAVPLKVGKRTFLHYGLTEKGKKKIEAAMRIEEA